MIEERIFEVGVYQCLSPLEEVVNSINDRVKLGDMGYSTIELLEDFKDQLVGALVDLEEELGKLDAQMDIVISEDTMGRKDWLLNKLQTFLKWERYGETK